MAEGSAAPSLRTLTLGELASLVGGRLTGDANLEIKGVSPLATALPDHIALVVAGALPSRRPSSHSQAGALLVAAECGERTRRYPAPRGGGRSSRGADPRPGIPPIPSPRRALECMGPLSWGAVYGWGAEVEVGPYAVVGEGTEVGDRVRVGAHAMVGPGCRIGADSVLHPQVTLYSGVLVGQRGHPPFRCSDRRRRIRLRFFWRGPPQGAPGRGLYRRG